MNLLLSIIEPQQLDIYNALVKRVGLSVNLELHGRGTASGTLLEKLRLEATPKRVMISIAGKNGSARLLRGIRRELYIDAPGNGIAVCVPVKSVGGAKTLEYLKGNEEDAATPRAEFANELIIAICNEGSSESVMDAARACGARGGTIVHAKGSANGAVSRFYNVTISPEKEMILIVAPAGDKAAIMRGILKDCGPASPSGAIVFSLPVSEAMGLSTASVED